MLSTIGTICIILLFALKLYPFSCLCFICIYIQYFNCPPPLILWFSVTRNVFCNHCLAFPYVCSWFLKINTLTTLYILIPQMICNARQNKVPVQTFCKPTVQCSIRLLHLWFCWCIFLLYLKMR